MSLAVMVIWPSDSPGTLNIPSAIAHAVTQRLGKRLVGVSVKMNLIISIHIQHQACHDFKVLITALARQSQWALTPVCATTTQAA
jgi:hypothetical protein